jgi:hypothetical protein
MKGYQTSFLAEQNRRIEHGYRGTGGLLVRKNRSDGHQDLLHQDPHGIRPVGKAGKWIA